MRWLAQMTAVMLAVQTVGAEASPKIGVSWPGLAGFAMQAESEMIRGTVAGALGSVIETDARMSAAKQILDMRNLIAAKVGTIIVSAVDTRAIEPVVSDALSAGINVVAYEHPIEVPGVFTITFNQTDVGRLQALALHAARPRGNWVLLKGDFDDPQTAQLYAGQMSVLKDSISAGLIRIAGETYTPGGLSPNARRGFVNILDENRNHVDAVLTPDDASAEAVVAVLRERDLAGNVAVAGHGGDPATLNRIARGFQTATIWEDHAALARKAADIALRLADGTSPKELGVAKSPTGAAEGTSYELHLQPFTINIDSIGLALTAGWIDVARLCEGVHPGSLPECD